MIILPRIYTLKDEAQSQLYEWFDKEVRSLPKDKNGKVDSMGEGLVDNDVDAMRHAFPRCQDRCRLHKNHIGA